MTGNYQLLIRKLDEFIRKYYRNQLLKGILLFVALFLFSYLVITGLEFIGHFGILTRTILFYIFIGANLLISYYYILIPLLKIRKIGRVITHDQASLIIGEHFTDIQDKLLNTLQLHKLSLENAENMDLINAGIDQKISQLSPIPFTAAIDLSKNRKFLKFTLPPVIILLLLLLISPSILTRTTDRIIHHSKVFAEEMPFRLVILNKNMEVFQQEDFTLKIKVTGDQLPDELLVESEGVTFKMSKESNINFSYTFKSLQKSKMFRILAGKYTTGEYEILVYPKPTILNFDLTIDYPPYLNRKQEQLENTGDLIIPEGSNLTWRFFTKDVDTITMLFDSTKKSLKKSRENVFDYSGTFFKNTVYSVKALNPYVHKSDSLAFSITVIQDAMPTIAVKEANDTLIPSRLYFDGLIKDDYGFSKLTFNYTVLNVGDTSVKHIQSEELAINKSINQQQFYYSVDLTRISPDPVNEVNYYFEICDNDGLHGPKCARTMVYKYKAPTPEEIDKMTSAKEQKIEKNLENTLNEARKLQRQIDEVTRKMTEKNNLTWQDKKQLEDLLQKEKQIKENLDNLQKQNELKNNFEEQYNPPDSSIMEKQRQLSDLFKDVMDEEMKKMVEEIKEMLDKIDKTQVNQMLEKMKMNNKDLEKQLDRTLDLYKQIEFDKKLAETIDALKKLAEKQDELSEKVLQKENTEEKAKGEQEEIENKFDEQRKAIDELEEKNKKLEDPAQFPNTGMKQEKVKEDIEESKKSLEKKDRQNSSKSQKDAAKGMNSMAEELQKMKDDKASEESAEDSELIRQILENLVRISFDQEDIMNRTKIINRNDPKYLNLIQEQNDLKEDLAMVEDSLTQLAKRQIMIKPFIMREISSINSNVEQTVKSLADRNIQIAATKQQFTMTSVNDLALMLAESLKKMESEANSQCNKPGKSSCNKPGGKGSKSMKSLRQLQEQLNKQLQGLKSEMESDSKQGEGKKGSTGKKQMSEKLARLAAEQEAIRNEMKKYQDQLNEQGIKSGGNLNDAMMKMEETETDLVNKRILQETMNRQQDILTRLLESERAELKRDQEEKRESTEAKNQKYSNPSGNFQYNRNKTTDTDLLKTTQPTFNYFYKTKINSYFLKFE